MSTDQPIRVLILGKRASIAAIAPQFLAAEDTCVVGALSEDGPANSETFPQLGKPAALPAVLANHPIDLVLLASSDLECAAAALRTAAQFGIPARILPSVSDLLHDRVRVSRRVGLDEIDHHLDSSGIQLPDAPHPAVVEAFRRRTVLITGAGGSIGSELARQVTLVPASRLVLLDHDENALVERTADLQNAGPPLELVPVIGDIRSPELLRSVFRRYAPHIVLHAAAYKHVPILEDNACEAVLNNVSGTRELAHAALESGSERFVFISTDKAVRPSSVMGATKRIAELIVQQQAGLAAALGRSTRFACVRFVNVLGSRGSVVPIFLRQIAAGGPLTITHEDMTRHFMTIAQASQLVLQASTLSSGSGDIFVLEMGDPVRILDLARKLIHLSGLRPEYDVPIHIIGIRPGEKLHEELAGANELFAETGFPYIFQVKASPVPANFPAQLAGLESAARAHQSGRVHDLLAELPIEYPTVTVSSDPISS